MKLKKLDFSDAPQIETGQEYPLNISEIKRQIAHYNDIQFVYNEEKFGPLQNDSVVIVVQVSSTLILK